jgi:paraquat-inducible protein A
VLARRRSVPRTHPLACALTGLALLGIAACASFLRLDAAGLVRDSDLLSGPKALAGQGYVPLALVVLATTVVIPFIRLAGLAAVILGVHRGSHSRRLARLLAWTGRLAPWSMVEVFLLGGFVAYANLVDLAEVLPGAAAWALGALMLASAATDSLCDRDALWEALTPPALPPPSPNRTPVSCPVCGLLCDAPPRGRASTCPRCASRLHHRKPASLERCTALLIAATLLYLPANILPVMTVLRLGHGGPHTILSGVEGLIAAGMWPLALLVFFASITVPVLKLVSLSVLVLATHRGSRRHLRIRALLFRVVDAVGRWSMIDVFMVSILTSVVQFGAIATIVPGPGVLAFCAVVILTMFAAEAFDPRLMWDRRS